SRASTSVAAAEAARLALAAVPLVDEPVAAAEQLAAEQPSQERSGDRVDEEADRDPDHEKQPVLRRASRLGRAVLDVRDAAGRVPELADRVPDLVLEILVGHELGCGIGDLA